MARLFCENDLVDRKLKAPMCLFPEDFIKGFVLARQAANTFLSAAEDASSDQVKDLVTGKSGFLLQLDRGMIVEIPVLLGMLGVGGEKKLQEELLACVPCLASVAKQTLEGARRRSACCRPADWPSSAAKVPRASLPVSRRSMMS